MKLNNCPSSYTRASEHQDGSVNTPRRTWPLNPFLAQTNVSSGLGLRIRNTANLYHPLEIPGRLLYPSCQALGAFHHPQSMHSGRQSSRASPAVSAREIVSEPRVLPDHPDPLGLHPVRKQKSSTRQVSASYPTEGPPFCPPVVGTSSLTASTTHTQLPTVYATAVRSTRKLTPTSIPDPKALTATSYETATARCILHDENIPPSSTTSSLQQEHRYSLDNAVAKLHGQVKIPRLGTIPKSSTLSVISNLTASISRNSLVKASRSSSISSTGDLEVGTSTVSSSLVAFPCTESGNIRQVHTAQSSAYWTGRFMALQDKFRNEMFLPMNMTTLITAHAQRSIAPDCISKTPKYMPASTSNPNLAHTTNRARVRRNSRPMALSSQPQTVTGNLGAERLEDEENRTRRVFLHLEALCTTSEARKSLRAWQQAYARRTGKEQLLPRGGTMEDKGWMGRLLGRGNHGQEKRASYTGIAFR